MSWDQRMVARELSETTLMSIPKLAHVNAVRTVMPTKGPRWTGASPSKKIGAVKAMIPALMSAWYLSIYVVNGLFLAVLVLALEARFRDAAPHLAAAVRAFGLIWATLVIGAGMVANVGLGKVVALHSVDPAGAVALWKIVELVENGLGGGNEIVGGVLAVLVGAAGRASGRLPRALSGFSLLVGGAGLVTVLPPLRDAAGAIFGLGYIGWFAWVGVVLWRHDG